MKKRTPISLGQLKKMVIESIMDEDRMDEVHGLGHLPVGSRSTYTLRKDATPFKPFDMVDLGDIGTDFDNEPVIVVGKGAAGSIRDPDGTIGDAIDAGVMEKGDPCVVVVFCDPKLGSKPAVYAYAGEGVTVPKDAINVRNLKYYR